MTETGVLLRHGMIFPVIHSASDAVCQYRNVDVLIVEWISSSLEHQHVAVAVLRQTTGEHRSSSTSSDCPTVTVISMLIVININALGFFANVRVVASGGATPRRARSNDLTGRSTELAPSCLLLCFGNSVNRK